MTVKELIIQLLSEEMDAEIFINTENTKDKLCAIDGISKTVLAIEPEFYLIYRIDLSGEDMYPIINTAIEKLSILMKDDFHGFRSEIYSVLAEVMRKTESKMKGEEYNDYSAGN